MGEVSDPENPATDDEQIPEEGGEMEEPSEDEETPVIDPIEASDEEETLDSAIDPAQMMIMEVEDDEPVEPEEGAKTLWVSIDNNQNEWKLTAVDSLDDSNDQQYITVKKVDGYDAFSADGSTYYSVNVEQLEGKILAFGAEPQDGYKFKSENENDHVKATLVAGDNEKGISAAYVEAVDNGAPEHYEINLGTSDISSSDFGESSSGTLWVWADVVEKKPELSKDMISLTGEGVTYDGEKETYTVDWKGVGAVEPVVEVTDGEKTLVEGTDYSVEYSNNEEEGTATVTVTGINYDGEITLSFTIIDVRVELKGGDGGNCAVEVDPDEYTYTGEEIIPTTITVTYTDEEDEPKELEEDKDYTVVGYEGNEEVGSATVTIEGKGDYKGEVTGTFTIVKAGSLDEVTGTIYADTADAGKEVKFDLSAFAFTQAGEVVEPSSYAISTDENAVNDNGDVLGKNPSIAGSVLSYTLVESFESEDELEDATITITASFDNYADGTLIVTIKAVPKTELHFKAEDITKTYTSQEIVYDGEITQTDEEDHLDEVKSNFVYSYDPTPVVDAGTYTVTISLSNHDTYKAEDFKATLTIAPKEVTLTPKDQSYIVGSDTLPSKDYTVNPKLYDGDSIETEPTLTYTKADGTVVSTLDEWKALEVGEQLTIKASGASAGSNYTINYGTGTVIVKPDKSTPVYTYNVTLHNVDHLGKNAVIAVQAGQKIDKAAADAKLESQTDYTFLNWYKDEACTKLWAFETETVQADTDLYAVWVTVVSDAVDTPILQIRDIPLQFYTGNKIQPNVQVYDKLGNELKKGKDYTITYTNNINADAKLEDEAHAGGYMGRDGQNGDGQFNENLPYVTITGKGNYAGTKTEPNVIKKNFSIKKASIGEGNSLAAGFTMKYTNQFVVGTKDLKPFTSLKYKKAMTLGTDYSVTIKGSAAKVFTKDADGNAVAVSEEYSASNNGKTAPVITKGYFGDFTLVVKGMEGNYTGEVEIPVVVAADSSKLLKNAKINLGKNVKTVDFSGAYFDDVEEAIILPAANVGEDGKYYTVNGSEVAEEASDVKDVFTVSVGKGKTLTYLSAIDDYVISYSNNDAVGKATLTVTAKEGSKYVGSVSATFTIKGKAFKNGNKGTVKVTGIEDQDYTGSPITLNEDITVATVAGDTKGEGDDAVFVPEKTFVFGQEYTVKYTNNIKKGKATVTFTANPKSGYTGSFKETFKIGDLSLMNKDLVEGGNARAHAEARVEQTLAADGKSAVIGEWTTAAEYAVAGSTLNYYLKDKEGNELRKGTDYTEKYANNKAVTTAATKPNKMPTLTITGKGNYSGKIVITFTIVNGNTRSIQATAAATQLNAKKPDTYEYKPAITVKNSTKAVNKKDYEVTYANNTQEDVKKYLEKLEAGEVEDAKAIAPTATIKIKDTSSFYTAKPVEVPEEGDTSTQEEGETAPETEPDTWDADHNTKTVYLPIYKEKLTAKNCTINLTANPSEYRYTGEKVTPTVVSVMFGGKELTRGTNGDVVVSYGANIAAGKNKGTVTVTGQGIYGGSVTKKFNIDTSYIYRPDPNTVEKTELTADITRVTLMLDGTELAKDEDGKYYAYANSDGSAVEPTVKLELITTAGKKTTYTELFKGDTYAVSYENNTAAGEAKVTITILPTSELYEGGPIEVNFNIVAAPVEEPPVDPDNRDLSKCEVILYMPDAEELENATPLADYTGNVEGVAYAITVDEIPNGGVKPVVVVKNGTDTLNPDTDYTVTYKDNEELSNENTVAAVVIGAAEESDFTGSKEVKFWITKATDLSDYTVVVKQGSNEVEPDSENNNVYKVIVTANPEDGQKLDGVELEVKANEGGEALTAGADYEVVWAYDEAEQDGTIPGTGSYTGSITVTFSITVDDSESVES